LSFLYGGRRKVPWVVSIGTDVEDTDLHFRRFSSLLTIGSRTLFDLVLHRFATVFAIRVSFAA
jgi:hypothetical protein